MRPDIALRRAKYANTVTPAMVLFGGGEMITTRPPEMSKELFNRLSKIQTKTLKNIFRKPADSRIARLMVPRRRSLFHLLEIEKRRVANETVEEEQVSLPTLIQKVFGKIRKLYGLQ